MVHRESSSRASQSHDWQRRTRAHNRRLFAERWGPQARREYLLDRFSRRGYWTDPQPPHLAVVLAGRSEDDLEAWELADALENDEWRVSLIEPSGDGWPELPVDADFIVVTDPAAGVVLPPAVCCIPWVRDRLDAWLAAPLLRRAELTLISSLDAARGLEAAGIAPRLFAGASEAGRLSGLLRERVQRLRFCLKLSREPDLEPISIAVRRSLELREHACMVQLADEWEMLGGMMADVALLAGEPDGYLPKPSQVNVLWAPGGIPPTECDRWDLVLVADEPMAGSLGSETPTLVAALDLSSTADPAEPLLDLVARAVSSHGLRSRVAAR